MMNKRYAIFLLYFILTPAYSSDEHAGHQAMLHNSDYTKTTARYTVPEVTLLNQAGEATPLKQILTPDKPIALNFIFTTCTTICPVMSATFAKMQQLLGDAANDLNFVSISIDPEYDRPAVLKAYAEQYHAPANWQFFTGDVEAIETVLKAFDAYSGNKTNHRPLTFFKRPDKTSWIRIEGLTSAQELVNEYQQLSTAKAQHHH